VRTHKILKYNFNRETLWSMNYVSIKLLLRSKEKTEVILTFPKL
jgi:hypothetical protein